LGLCLRSQNQRKTATGDWSLVVVIDWRLRLIIIISLAYYGALPFW